MASLPSNTFMFNYNAREYNSSTRTFPKTEGQLFDQDLVLNNTPGNIGEDFVRLANSAYMGKTYNSTSANPFNRDSSHNSFTLIYKTSGDSGNQNIVANRGSGYNYMARSTMFHTSQSGFLSLTANTNPHITLVRIYADGKSERKFLDSSGNVLQSTSASSISWGNASNAFGFFSGYGNQSAENFSATFYWMYCSLETLTDAEVLKVIQYNENTGPTFEVDTTAITATYSATTSSVTLTTEEDMAWTASTSNNWITLSTTGGTGSSVFTISIAANKAYTARNGLVTVSNGEDTIEITVEQGKCPLFIPAENIYRADLEVVKAYRSGSTINKAYRSGELIYLRLNPPSEEPPTPVLPSNTFLINYNARFYDPTTNTIPKTEGQLFDYDMVLNAAACAYTADHITVNGQYFNVELGSTGANPFNLTSASPFTIIAKTSRGLDSSGEHTIASCRAGGVNWILFNPGNNSGVDKVFMYNTNRYATDTPFVTITSEPNIYAIRINNGSGYGQSFTDNTTERSIAVNYNGTSTRFGIFTDTYRMGGFEIWRGDFYWMYISTEALTDDEIQQVIDYNENINPTNE